MSVYFLLRDSSPQQFKILSAVCHYNDKKKNQHAGNIIYCLGGHQGNPYLQNDQYYADMCRHVCKIKVSEGPEAWRDQIKRCFFQHMNWAYVAPTLQVLL